MQLMSRLSEGLQLTYYSTYSTPVPTAVEYDMGAPLHSTSRALAILSMKRSHGQWGQTSSPRQAGCTVDVLGTYAYRLMYCTVPVGSPVPQEKK